MKLVFTESAWEDYLWFQDNDPRLVRRINTLIKAAMRTPSEGIGKPERLRANLSGYWSRRINEEHRLVYRTTETEFIVVACRFHYQK
ncbi:MAG: Txe/YoeB family addiction module toxin [Caldilineaceae bacterium]|nr:Txe/YoeB family addiction module toxin [Caldilineaceae bacterium]